MYLGLRGKALNVKAADIRLTPELAVEPYGIVMDMDIDGRTATFVAFATGEASVYLSTGGGTIGAGQASQDVSVAAKEFVAAAKPYVPAMAKVSEHPLPGVGEITFYVLTPGGVHTATRLERALGEGNEALSPLFYAGHRLMTQIRRLDEQQTKEPQQRN